MLLPFLLLLVESELTIRIIMIYLQGNVNASQVPLGGREISLALFTHPLWIYQMASDRVRWSRCSKERQGFRAAGIDNVNLPGTERF